MFLLIELSYDYEVCDNIFNKAQKRRISGDISSLLLSRFCSFVLNKIQVQLSFLRNCFHGIIPIFNTYSKSEELSF